MLKAYRCRMEQLPRQIEFLAAYPIGLIAYDTVPDRRHMDAYLMSAPRFEPALDQCISSESLKHSYVRDRLSSARNDSHLLSVRRVACYGPVDRQLIFLYVPVYKRKIFPQRLALLELRRKLRLRIYDPAQGFAMLEMKQKSGPYQLKRSLRLTREDAQRLARGDYSPLLGYPEPFAAECYELMATRCYRHKTVVEYDRTAYIARENHIRITFDRRIRASESDMELFAPCPAYSPVMDPFGLVLEVKYNGFILSYIKDLLNSVRRPEVSVSKYCLARSFTLGAMD